MYRETEGDPRHRVVAKIARYSPDYAITLDHLLTHMPKNMHCIACRQAKVNNVPYKKGDGITERETEKFGEKVTADTIVLRNNKDRGIGGENNAIVMFDFKKGWIHCSPVHARNTDETVRAINEFRGPGAIINLYADQAGEFTKACDRIGTCRAKSTPGVPRTNSIAELKVKEVINGARALLKQAGLEPKWWPYAVQTYCFHKNNMEVNGLSAYQKRYGNDMNKVKLIPFGCLVDFLPIAPKPRKGEKNIADADQLERGDDDDVEDILREDEDDSSRAAPAIDESNPGSRGDTQKSNAGRTLDKARQLKDLDNIDVEALKVVGTENYNIDEAKRILSLFAEKASVIRTNKRAKIARGKGYFIMGFYAHGGIVGITSTMKNYPGITSLCCSLVRRLSPHTTFTTVLISIGVKMGPHKDKFNDGTTDNVIIPLRDPRKMKGIWVERMPGDEIRDEMIMKTLEVAPEKKVEGFIMPMREIISFNPRRWHASEEGGNMDERILLIAYTLTAGKRGSEEHFMMLKQLGFNLGETFGSERIAVEAAAVQGDRSDEDQLEEERRSHELPDNKDDWIESNVYPAAAARAKFEPSTLPGLFLGYSLQPGGVPNGDYVVVELSNLFNGWKIPTIHQVKRVVLDKDGELQFPMQAVADRKARLMTAKRADELARLQIAREREGGLEDAIFHNRDRLRADIQREIEHDNKMMDNGDFWEHAEDSKEWILHHILPRRKLCVPGNERYGTGGPGDLELHHTRKTHMTFKDGNSETLVDDRLTGRESTIKKWTGCTIFWEKGADVEESPDGEQSEGARRKLGMRGVGLDYEQDKPRIERPYARSYKPNSISSEAWTKMSVRQRKEYTKADRERILGESNRNISEGPDPQVVWKPYGRTGCEYEGIGYVSEAPPDAPVGILVWAVRADKASGLRICYKREKPLEGLWWRTTRCLRTNEVLESIVYDKYIQDEIRKEKGNRNFPVVRDIVTEYWYLPEAQGPGEDSLEDSRQNDDDSGRDVAAAVFLKANTGTDVIRRRAYASGGIVRKGREYSKDGGAARDAHREHANIIRAWAGSDHHWIRNETMKHERIAWLLEKDDRRMGFDDHAIVAVSSSCDGLVHEIELASGQWTAGSGPDAIDDALVRITEAVLDCAARVIKANNLCSILWKLDKTMFRFSLEYDLWMSRIDGCVIHEEIEGRGDEAHMLITNCDVLAIISEFMVCDHTPRVHEMLDQKNVSQERQIDIDIKCLETLASVAYKTYQDILRPEEGSDIDCNDMGEPEEYDNIGTGRLSSSNDTLDRINAAPGLVIPLDEAERKNMKRLGEIEAVIIEAYKNTRPAGGLWTISLEKSENTEELGESCAPAQILNGIGKSIDPLEQWKRVVFCRTPTAEVYDRIAGRASEYSNGTRAVAAFGKGSKPKIWIQERDGHEHMFSIQEGRVALERHSGSWRSLSDQFLIVPEGKRYLIEEQDDNIIILTFCADSKDNCENPSNIQTYDDLNEYVVIENDDLIASENEEGSVISDDSGFIMFASDNEDEDSYDSALSLQGKRSISIQFAKNAECYANCWETNRESLIISPNVPINIDSGKHTWLDTGMRIDNNEVRIVEIAMLPHLVAEFGCRIEGYEYTREHSNVLILILNQGDRNVIMPKDLPIARVQLAAKADVRPEIMNVQGLVSTDIRRHYRVPANEKKANTARKVRKRVNEMNMERILADSPRVRLKQAIATIRRQRCRSCKKEIARGAIVPSLLLMTATLCMSCFMEKHVTPVDDLIRKGHKLTTEMYGDGIAAVPAAMCSEEDLDTAGISDGEDGLYQEAAAIIIEDDEDEYEHVMALVARPVTKAERAVNPKARASLDKEWNKLMLQEVWEMDLVRSWKDVSREAQSTGEVTHVGRIFDICVEKNWELPEDDPLRKYKGRVVFEGCNVKDQDSRWAIFQEITSCPATLEAGKMADAYGMLPGHIIQMSDGESAYTQARLGGPRTWVRIPKERWPEHWHNIEDPVVPLKLALYGHPDAGGFWEKHCEEAVLRS